MHQLAVYVTTTINGTKYSAETTIQIPEGLSEVQEYKAIERERAKVRARIRAKILNLPPNEAAQDLIEREINKTLGHK